MRIPEIPNIPIPPATELKKPPRPILEEVYDSYRLEGEVVTDSLEISPDAQAFEASRELVKRVLAQFEQGHAEDAQRQMAASREELDAALEDRPDASPQATARVILDGVTGYIFDAYREHHPEMTGADLEEFRRQAEAGVRKGYEEARSYLEDAGMFGDDIKARAEETVRRVVRGVDEFVDEALAQGVRPEEPPAGAPGE
ncbi:MAG: DUF5610 domain-containing protein [Planctomycetes bacterium]|nr:DUF5610 domain-containing protein [Planctomycetota bacterium]